MEIVKVLQLLAILSTLSIVSVKGQIATACSASMITTFTPCLNFITGSSSNGSSPTQDCCAAREQNPGTRGLPRACNMAGVPVQCKASGTPLPAPGPVPFLLSPTLPPTAASPLSSESDLTPAAPPKEEPEAPSATVYPRIRPVLQPAASASNPSFVYPPSILVTLIGITIFKFY
ncbi:embryo sac development arrest 4, glycosylphosphatidylinositol-anchored lipid protein transfer 16 [Hibiscus trionum]|uniref:Embryo sac development arrest 4, glycosylphosphatidylinositol-anchored lipid protein transfer 16 n=1 Tax=Hibiscus trionum TaxID=183268 RepID=A0A9W7JA43_HIBTR|nr:embryo sac development arrest 4, glycosylphosphatidylinositol-anchored lipid protein transfer 16 [Hibiscus trionum]